MNATTNHTFAIKIKRPDGIELGFTDLDVDFDFDGVTYRAGHLDKPTTVNHTAHMSVSNAEIMGVFKDGGILRDDVLNGLYAGADFTIFVYDYIGNSAIKTLVVGSFGEITVTDYRYTAELRSLSQKFQQPIGELTSPVCRVGLGDPRCGIDLSALYVNGAVTDVTNFRAFADTGLTQGDEWFTGGVLEWLSGENAGAKYEVASYKSAGFFSLFTHTTFPIKTGDEFTVNKGCNRTFDDCVDKHDNAINFQGEDDLPQDRIDQTNPL